LGNNELFRRIIMISCYECGCVDSSDNPVIGIEDDFGNVEEYICLECLVTRGIGEEED
jgi:hypothetical protein